MKKVFNTLIQIYLSLWNGFKWLTPFRDYSMGSNWVKWKYLSKFLNINAGFNGVIVDIGCGIGAWTYRIARTHPKARVIGIDKSINNIKNQPRIIPRNMSFIIGNADSIPLKSLTIDKVLTMQMYEHLTYPQEIKFLNEVERILKAKGYLVLNIPGDLISSNRFPIYKSLSLFPFLVKRYPVLKFFKENKRYPHEWHGHTTPGFSPSNIAAHIKQAGSLYFCQYAYAFKKMDAIHFQVRSLSKIWGMLIAPLSFGFAILDSLHNSKGLDLTCQIQKGI